MTILNNRPLKPEQFDMEQLLIEGSLKPETLGTVIIIVCRVLMSTVSPRHIKCFFTKENPWVDSILNLILEAKSIYQGDSKIHKEVEVLFRNMQAMDQFSRGPTGNYLLRDIKKFVESGTETPDTRYFMAKIAHRPFIKQDLSIEDPIELVEETEPD